MTLDVVIIQELLAEYRVSFYEHLQKELDVRGVRVRLLYGRASGDRAMRGDESNLAGAIELKNLRLSFGGRYLLWQRGALRIALRADLIVVEQANKHILNYLLLLLPATRKRLAFWGHGADLQAGRDRRVSSALKRLLASRPAWWFAYTSGAAARVRESGFPAERITIVQNAVDTTKISEIVPRVEGRCVFIGGLHGDKRISFLLEVARLISAIYPAFELVIIGDGPERGGVLQASEEHPFIRRIPPQFGADKARWLLSSQIILMPGLVGLVAVDSFSSRTPIVTIDSPTHSPEFEYLNQENSVILRENCTAATYASSVVELLNDNPRLDSLRDGCSNAASVYTVEAMAQRFARGIQEAVKKP